MPFVGDFKCPQYVNFKEEFNKAYDSLTDAEVSLCSIEDDIKSESMHVDDETETSESYHPQDKISYSKNSQPMPCASYLSYNSYQESMGDSETEEFPVNRPQLLSLPEKTGKNNKTNKTETRPFHLHESKKRKREDECNEYIPMAEQVAAFHNKTPKRFHSTGPKAYEPSKHWSPKLIKPQTPNLQAVKRTRGVNVLSREEQEAKEAEEMKKYRFRAQPVQYDKLSDVQLSKVQKKLPTKPKDLQLRTAQRAAEMNARKKEEEKPYEFHARPVPKAIINGPTGLKEKSSLRVTEPHTPNFALKRRAEKWRNEKKLEPGPETKKFKAMPAPAATSHFAVKHEKKFTEIQPFSFEAKDKERLAKKESKINEIIEKENKVFVFKAQSMPSPAPSALPPVPKKPPTHPEPFNLCTNNRSFKHSTSNLSDQVCSNFKAQPATVLQKPPFIPEKPLKLPIETLEFQLHTDIRAAERQKLKEEQDIKDKEKELLLQEFKRLQEENERQEILKIRKEAVHKANPVRHFKPFELKPSNKVLTQPVSPKFHTEERLQSRHME